MVTGFVATRAVVDSYREEIQRFAAASCRTGRMDPHQQLAILVGVVSNVGQEVAAEIAGPEWVDRHVGSWVMGDSGRREAEDKWRRRGTTPPQWPFAILGDGAFAVWLAPFDDLPAHLTWLWNDARWFEAPERPAGSMPCVVEAAVHVRLWIDAATL